MSVTVRTNRATNPNAATASTNWVSVSGTGGNASSAHNAGAGYSGNGFVRVTWSVATTAVSGGIRYTQTGLSASTQYSHQMFVKSSKTQTVRLAAQYQNSTPANVGTAFTGTPVALVAGVWAQVKVEGATSGAGVDRVLLTAEATTGGVNWANGDTLDGDLVVIETGPTCGTEFDGASTDAAGVLYAWTGTANASTSTATLYTPVLTLVAKLDAPTDRVEITVTDLTPTENVVTLWRTADGKRVAVVDARKVEVTGSDFFEDFACPLGRLLTYDLEVFSGAGSGAPNSSSTVTVNATSGWIQDPIVPASSIRVYADAAPAGQPVLADDAAKSLQYKSDVALFQVLGTAEPVAVIGQRQAAGSVSFAMDTETAAQGTALRDLILQSPLLLVRPLPAWGAMLPGLCYIAPDSPEEQPFNISWGGGIEGWKITAPLVNPPATGILVPTNTYGTVQALWTTYQQAQTALTGDTYLDVRKSPSGA